MSDLRDLILSKSTEIIAKTGIRGLSFREVARRAEVSHQAPYHYFKNDSEILTAIAKEGFAKLGGAMLASAAQHANDPIAALNAAGVAYVVFAIENLGHFRVMFERTLLPKDVSISNLEEARQAYGVLQALVSKVIDYGEAVNLGPEELTMLCWSTAHGLAALLSEGIGVVGNDKKSQAQLATQIIGALGRFIKAANK
jgi:AcrR family transcriptional regulator